MKSEGCKLLCAINTVSQQAKVTCILLFLFAMLFNDFQ